MLSVESVCSNSDQQQALSLLRLLYPKLSSVSEEKFYEIYDFLCKDFYFQIVLLKRDQRALGLLSFRSSFSFAFWDHIYVNDLIVLPEERGKRYGSYLLDWVKKKAKNESKALHLDVREDNYSAMTFYKKNGLKFKAVHGAWV